MGRQKQSKIKKLSNDLKGYNIETIHNSEYYTVMRAFQYMYNYIQFVGD